MLVFPKNTTNPYQDMLYDEMRVQGQEVRFLASPTWSHTVNILLIPLLLGTYRLRGFRILHIHWTYGFAPVWVRVVPLGRRLMQQWFRLCLATARWLGFRVVWTAHNLLPLGRVFADEVAARKLLIRATDAVIAHSAITVEPLRAMGAKNVRVIRFGSYRGHYAQSVDRPEARRRLDIGRDERVVAFVGAVEPYKGVDSLLEAAGQIPEDVALRIIVAGRCGSAGLLHHLRQLAGAAGPRVTTRFEYLPDDELQLYFVGADAIVFPFHRITNSSSLLLALAFGVPVIIPDIPELAELPDDLALRYAGNVPALADMLTRVALMDGAALAAMGRAAKSYESSLSWEQCARETRDVYDAILLRR